jgi:hypothetical protein
VRSESRCALIKFLEMTFTSVDTGLNNVPSRYRKPHPKFLVMQGFYTQSIRILRQQQSRVLCVNITQEAESGFICKQHDITGINCFRLNKIYKPFTATDPFFTDSPVSIFAPLLLFMGRGLIFFSDRFMHCCKADIFRLPKHDQ